MAGVAVAMLAYAGLTGGALGPGYGHVLPTVAVAKAPVATLSFSGTDPIITGSVKALFETVGTFVGPNEAMKQDRLRPDVDVLALTRSFDNQRIRIASLAAGNAAAAPVSAKTVVADAVKPVSPTAVSAKIAIAAVDPSVVASPAEDTPALNAIDSAAAPAPGVPMPATLPSKLAYAREDAPITVFPDKPTSKYSARDLNCLAEAIYFEARGESYRGQVAVAQVVMNRLRHPLYPKSICAVVFQDAGHRNACQFSFACDGIPEVINEKKPGRRPKRSPQKLPPASFTCPKSPTRRITTPVYVYPDWAPRLKRVTKIGMHIFYKFKNA